MFYNHFKTRNDIKIQEENLCFFTYASFYGILVLFLRIILVLLYHKESLIIIFIPIFAYVFQYKYIHSVPDRVQSMQRMQRMQKNIQPNIRVIFIFRKFLVVCKVCKGCKGCKIEEHSRKTDCVYNNKIF